MLAPTCLRVVPVRYFKRLEMPEMHLLQLVAEPSRLSWDHNGATLTVHYSKPPALLAEVREGGTDAVRVGGFLLEVV